MSKFPARQAEPGQLFNHHDGVEVELRANGDGIVRPKTLAEHRLAEAFHIPLADGETPYAGPLHVVEAEPAEEEAASLAAPAARARTSKPRRLAAPLAPAITEAGTAPESQGADA